MAVGAIAKVVEIEWAIPGSRIFLENSNGEVERSLLEDAVVLDGAEELRAVLEWDDISWSQQYFPKVFSGSNEGGVDSSTPYLALIRASSFQNSRTSSIIFL